MNGCALLCKLSVAKISRYQTNYSRLDKLTPPFRRILRDGLVVIIINNNMYCVFVIIVNTTNHVVYMYRRSTAG